MTHPNLLRLMKRIGIKNETLPTDEKTWKTFVEKLSKIYEEQDQDRYLTERALLLSSEELTLLNESLRIKIESQDHALSDHRAELINFSKLAALGEMSSGIAHEINNPLAIICGKADQMKRQIEEGKSEPEKLKEGLTVIKNTGKRITQIIKGLNSLSRKTENDPMVHASLRATLEETLALCKERFRSSSIELTLHFEGDVTLECRPAQISQVLVNLIGNAYHAVELLPEKWVKLEVTYDNQRIKIRVTDSGKGIPAEIQDKIMLPFFTTKVVGKGTGLGLSISKDIVEDHSGKFYYDREAPNTSFVVELPLLSTATVTSQSILAMSKS